MPATEKVTPLIDDPPKSECATTIPASSRLASATSAARAGLDPVQPPPEESGYGQGKDRSSAVAAVRAVLPAADREVSAIEIGRHSGEPKVPGRAGLQHLAGLLGAVDYDVPAACGTFAICQAARSGSASTLTMPAEFFFRREPLPIVRRPRHSPVPRPRWPASYSGSHNSRSQRTIRHRAPAFP